MTKFVGKVRTESTELSRASDTRQSASALPITPLEHTASADCWCEPTVEYRDPDTGVAVYLHKEIQ